MKRREIKMTFTQIEKLRPTFTFGQMQMVEWFEVTKGTGFCVIHSGLRHADGETKLPYHNEDFEGGKDASKNCLKRFNEWWETVKDLKL
jgi:hypothetical protein